jgi:hypothetical protein
VQWPVKLAAVTCAAIYRVLLSACGMITRFCMYYKNTIFPTAYKQMPDLHITLYRICFLPYPFPLIIHYHPTI